MIKIRRGSVAVLGVEISWKICRAPSHAKRIGNLITQGAPEIFKLHIGPGASWSKPSNEWLSVDIDPRRGDIVVDFNEFERFPLRDCCVEAIYASHVFEHVSMYRIGKVVSECYRVLKPGHVLRIVVPNPEVSIQEYVAGNEDFSLFRRRRERAKCLYGEDWTIFECLKNDFISLSGQSELLGEKLAHQNAWDFESMRAQLVRGGFSSEKIRRCEFQDIGTSAFSFEGTYPSEANEWERSLYVEATK